MVVVVYLLQYIIVGTEYTASPLETLRPVVTFPLDTDTCLRSLIGLFLPII